MKTMDTKSSNPPPGQIKHDDHSIGTLQKSSYDDHGTATPADDEMFFGDGDRPTNYNISFDQKTGIELGLKLHYRTGDDITPTSVDSDGTAHFNAPAGKQVVDPAHNVSSANVNRAAWNFDFSVNTGPDHTLDDYNFRIVIRSGDGESGTFDLQHVAPGNTPWINTPTTGGFADEDGGNTHLSQNSVNLNFSFLSSIFGADALNAGETYDITLQAFTAHGQIIAQVHDQLILV